MSSTHNRRAWDERAAKGQRFTLPARDEDFRDPLAKVDQLGWLGGDIRLNEEHTEYAWVAAEEFRNYEVMDGIDEDIWYLGIWPPEYLRADKLPRNVK